MSNFPRLAALLRAVGFALFMAIPGVASAAMLNGVECTTASVEVTTVNGQDTVIMEAHDCELGEPFPNAVCGDDSCNGNETSQSCPGDCPAPFCGDGSCNNGETQNSCPADCGVAGPVCGNNVCESGESTTSCPADCGQGPVDGCTVQNTISAQVRDGWFGLENVTFNPGETKRFCAVVTSSNNTRLRFEASDVSNQTCARFSLRVTQQGTGKSLSSGIAGSPSLRINAQVARGVYDYSLTAADTYFVDIKENNAPSHCRRADVAWRIN